MLPTRRRTDRDSERAHLVCSAKRLSGLLEVGLCDASVLRTFLETLHERPALLLERHGGMVRWTVFLLNRKDFTDEARAAGLAALRYYLTHAPDGEGADVWTETVRACVSIRTYPLSAAGLGALAGDALAHARGRIGRGGR